MVAKPAVLFHTELSLQEEKIESGVQAACDALRKIRDDGLFAEAGYGTFDQYVVERWGYSRTYAGRLIEHANIRDLLIKEGATILPNNEAQTRELVKVRERAKTEHEGSQNVALTWQMAVDKAPREQDVPIITAQDVESVARQFVNKPLPKKVDHDREKFKEWLSRGTHLKLIRKGSGYDIHTKYGDKVIPKDFLQLVKVLTELAEVAAIDVEA